MATTQPREIGAADAKQTLLKVLEELPPKGMIITERGLRVARLLPMARSTQDLFGLFKGRVRSTTLHRDGPLSLDVGDTSVRSALAPLQVYPSTPDVAAQSGRLGSQTAPSVTCSSAGYNPRTQLSTGPRGGRGRLRR
jgi:antitoxin (DNA-binding transcriptional repressor) of toxin-antitoxin stability system